ncbi:MAG: Mur ligase family protein, partial [Cyanobacteria bacterium P01_A01_bin.135]
MGHAIVIGLGKSGIAAARLLRRQGWQVTVSDRGNSEALQAVQQTLAAEGIAVKLGQSPWLEGASRVVVSPGVPWDSFPLLQARALGLEVVGEMELAWQALKAVPWIGITGTNGKTTVTALIESIFQAADLKAPACGNIGYAACEVALEAAGTAPPDWVIAEVSSYQIEASATLAPAISLWTTFTPDHLSRHVTLGRYYDIKAQLLRRSQLAVFNGDDPYLRQRHEDWPNAHWVTAQPEVSAITAAAATAVIEADWVWVAGQKLLPVA